jgi:hypothetical protein
MLEETSTRHSVKMEYRQYEIIKIETEDDLKQLIDDFDLDRYQKLRRGPGIYHLCYMCVGGQISFHLIQCIWTLKCMDGYICAIYLDFPERCTEGVIGISRLYAKRL